jgi:PBSX family phage terminase large subunit
MRSVGTRATNRGLVDKLLSPMQRRSIVETVDGDALVYLSTGSVSGGKTFASLIALFACIPKAPTHALIVLCGRSLLTIQRNIIDPMRSVELFGPLAESVHYTPGSSTAVILGRTIHLVGASDSRSEGRIRGATIGLAYVDEATLLPEAFWMMLMSRLRVGGPGSSGPRSKCLATTNPDSPAHYLRRNFILRANEVRMRVFEFRLHDNPALDPGYVETLKAQYVGLWRRRYVDGVWSIAEGAVFEMFDPDLHVITGPLPQMMRLPGVGLDYGTVAAFSAHLLGVAAPNHAAGTPARLVLAREFRHDPKLHGGQKTDAEFSKDLRAWIGTDRPDWVCVDPSAASFKAQLFKDGLSNVMDAKNNVLDSIRLASSLLATGQLVIHENCAALINEIPGYSWDPAAAAKGEDKPIKVDDHSVDSGLRYSVSSTTVLWQPYLSRSTQ